MWFPDVGLTLFMLPIDFYLLRNYWDGSLPLFVIVLQFSLFCYWYQLSLTPIITALNAV